MQLLLDTCALIWWTLDQEKLSPDTLHILNKSDVLLLSSISIWEVGIKLKNKKLDMGMSIQTYMQKLKEISILNILPVTEEIWIKNIELSWAHRDPADRTIVATAYLTESSIVTRDGVMIDYYPSILHA